MALTIVESIYTIKNNEVYMKRQIELDDMDKKLSKRLKVYETLSNPKTVQFYVAELNKIVDNMHRLGKIIDNGEEINVVLTRIEKTLKLLESQWDITLNNDLDMKETIKLVNNHIKEVDSRIRTDLESVLNKELEQIDLRIVKQFDQIENDLRDIRNLLTQIENSKIGKKIFNQ
tara:strand:- start:1000 stop:1521 length:522 start_codon:yes stop_codon:yes gene_type:complete